MTTFKGIAAVTQTFGFLAAAAIQGAVPDARITHERPEEPSAGSAKEPRLNIYLVQVVPEPTLRGHDLPTRTSPNGGLINAPQAPVNLRYLLSFFGASQKAQLMLGAMEVVLRERPILDAALVTQALAGHPELQDSGIEHQAPPIRLAPTTMTLEELSRFWSGFLQTPYTVSTVYEATTVMLTASGTPTAALPVASVGGGKTPGTGARLDPLAPVEPGAFVPVHGAGLTVGAPVEVDGTQAGELARRDGTLGFALPPATPAGTRTVAVGGAKRTLVVRPEVRRVRESGEGVSVVVDPPVLRGQTATLSLVALEPGGASAQLPAAAGAQGDRLQFGPLDALPAGRYLAMIDVDGASSLPAMVSGRYARPSVELHR